MAPPQDQQAEASTTKDPAASAAQSDAAAQTDKSDPPKPQAVDTSKATHYTYLKQVAHARPPSGDPENGGTPSASPIWRHIWSLEHGYPPPAPGGVKSAYEIFERSVSLFPTRRCLGWRPRIGTGADAPAGPYKFMTYAEAGEKAAAAAAGLALRGIKKGDKVAIYGSNSPEWMLAMQACNRQGFVCVPVYDTLGATAVTYTLSHSEASAVLVADGKVDSLTKALTKLESDSKLQTVITWGVGAGGDPAGQINSDSISLPVGGGKSVDVMTWAKLLETGAANPVAADPPAPMDTSTIMYTSGTTGNPKGVLISHKAIVTTVAGLALTVSKLGLNLGKEHDVDVMLSYLPLAHIFDRAAEELCLSLGIAIGYFRGDVKKLADDAQALKPTLYVGVPRVYERIYSSVKAAVNKGNFATKSLYNIMYGRKLARLQKGANPDGRLAPVADRLVFNRIRGQLGGNIRILVSGGAPLSEPVEEFLRVAFGCPVAQGYGLTESCAASFLQHPSDFTQTGTSGPVQPGTEFRLESVPELKHDALASPPAGEILIRGDQIFDGYYKDKEKTEETMTSDGFLRTGDIGTLTPDGCLKIFDRKKNIFKLSQGEYISVERVEGAYKESPDVEQIYVTGTSTKSCLVAIVVPHPKGLQKYQGGPAPEPTPSPAAGKKEKGDKDSKDKEADTGKSSATPAESDANPVKDESKSEDKAAEKPPVDKQESQDEPKAEKEEPKAEKGGKAAGEEGKAPAAHSKEETSQLSELCKDPAVVAGVLKALQALGKKQGLHGFELIRAVHLEPEQWGVENGMMTPSFKLKRASLQEKYQKTIDQLYESIGE